MLRGLTNAGNNPAWFIAMKVTFRASGQHGFDEARTGLGKHARKCSRELAVGAHAASWHAEPFRQFDPVDHRPPFSSGWQQGVRYALIGTT